jgi:hypothetical protein
LTVIALLIGFGARVDRLLGMAPFPDPVPATVGSGHEH